MRTKVRVSNTAFTNKQEAVDATRGFKAGFAAHDMNLTVEEMTNKWLSGYSILPARLQGLKSNDVNWVSQQVFAVDFDNENGDKERVSENYYVTPTNALDMAKNAGLSPAFIYSTFSSSVDHNKFRMIFVLDSVVTDKRMHEELTKKLLSVFIKNGYIVADTRCSEPSRIFYGGTECLYQDLAAVTQLTRVQAIGISNHPGISKLRSKRDQQGRRMIDYIPESLMHSSVICGVTTPAMSALISGDPMKLRECLLNGADSTIHKKENTGTVCTNMNPYVFVKQQPLERILGVPLNTPFRCIMHGHVDTHPSATVQQLENGTYAYYCYSCYGQGSGQSLIDMIIEATHCTAREALEFARIALDIPIYNEHQLLCREHCERILDFIQSPHFRTGVWEPLYRHMNQKKILGHYRYYLEQAAYNPISDALVGNGIPIIYEAVRETEMRMKGKNYPYCTGRDKDSVARKRNELAHLGLIVKSSNLDHPAFKKAKEYQKRIGNTYHKEFFFIPDLTEEILEFALVQIRDTKNWGERSKFRTCAGVLTSRGEDAAKLIYAQDAKKELSKYQNDFLSFMWKTVSQLTIKGWTTEEEIIEEIKGTSRYTGVTWKVGQYRPALTHGKDYTIMRVTKEIRTQLNIPEDIPIRKQIIVPCKESEPHLLFGRFRNPLPRLPYGEIDNKSS